MYSVDSLGRPTILIDAVLKVEDRIREDLGDMDEFIDSIYENGLLQPIVLEDDNSLIAGGRRFTAFKTLSKFDRVRSPEFHYIPFTRFGTLSPSKRRMLELEENLRRKSFTWQENVLGIADYHGLATMEANLDGEKWTQNATGQFFNINQSDVSVALMLAKHLKKKESPLWKLDSAFEAVKFLAQQELDRANLESKRRIEQRRAQITAVNTAAGTQTSATGTILMPVTPMGTTKAEGERDIITRDAISKMYFHGDFEEVIRLVSKSERIHHFITDPPYGINTDQMVQESIERIADTHKVEPNKKLIKRFLRVSFDVIQPDGFVCMWYDMDWHETIASWAEEIGWKVCRWPFVWCKTSSCQNNAAQYNITKATEVCYFFRRSEQSILKKKRHVNYLEASGVNSKSHPFIKPAAVWNWLIETVSTENQTIFDPFAGEGSCLQEAYKMNRIPFGAEIDEKHIAQGIETLHEELNRRAPELITDKAKIPF